VTPDDPSSVARYRLDALEQKVERSIAEMRAEVRAQLTRIEGSVERLQFVDVKLYQSEQRAQDKQISDTATLIAAVEKRMTDRADATDTRFQWLLGLVIGAIIVALAGGLVRLALG
jgi:tetrahydromethanopterin S-methyltransferase subunit G